MNQTTVFCDNCGANSNKVLVLVTRKKVRCYPCLTMAGITQMMSEPKLTPEEIYSDQMEDMLKSQEDSTKRKEDVTIE